MSSRIARRLVLAALVAAGPAASAGELGIEGHGGYFSMTAENSANAVFESKGGATFGGAVRYAFGNGIFVAAGLRLFSKEGERVFVATPSGPVARLGHPLTVEVNPYFLTAGYRLGQGRLVVPYAGAGVTLASYKEESEVAGERYEESFTKTGFHALAGVEVGRGLVRFGGEAAWSTVPDAIGLGGVTDVYGEDDIGGWTFLGKIVLTFGGASKPGAP